MFFLIQGWNKHRPLKIYLGLCSIHLSPLWQKVQKLRRYAVIGTFEKLFLTEAILPVRYTDSWWLTNLAKVWYRSPHLPWRQIICRTLYFGNFLFLDSLVLSVCQTWENHYFPRLLQTDQTAFSAEVNILFINDLKETGDTMVCCHIPLCLHHCILLCQLSKESHMHWELALLRLSQAFLLLLQQNTKLNL